jgi:hypothetical protein
MLAFAAALAATACGGGGSTRIDAAVLPGADAALDASALDASALDATALDATALDASADAATVDAAPTHPRVLLLGDHPVSALTLDASPLILSALTAASIDATDGGLYTAWDGTNPAPTGYDVVIWLQGQTYAGAVLAGLPPALNAYVMGGGVLVRTEWAAYNLGAASYAGIDALMPVSYANTWAVSATWHTADATNPYLTGITFPFTTTSGHSIVTANSTATVLAELTDNQPVPVTTPAVTVETFGTGKVFHLNHDVLYYATALDPPFVQLLVNIAHVTHGG